MTFHVTGLRVSSKGSGNDGGGSSSLGIVASSSEDEADSLAVGDERRFFLFLFVGDDGFDKIFIVTNGEDERLFLPRRGRFDS